MAAFAVLVTGLTLIAAAFTRHLHAVRLLADTVTAYRIADQTLQREFLKRRDKIEIEAGPLAPGFSAQVRQEEVTIRLETQPPSDVPMEKVRAQVNWSSRGQSRSSEITSSFPPPPPGES